MTLRVIRDAKCHLYIHIGIGKTATSAIQSIGRTLFRMGSGICMAPHGIIGEANNGFAANHPLFNALEFAELVKSVASFAISRGEPIFLSSEFLIRQSPESTANLLRSLQEHGLGLKVIAAIRNYPDLIVSSYLQALKSRYGMVIGESFDAYVDREMQSVRFPQLLKPWADHVGAHNVIVLDFDANKKDFVSKFFSILDCDISNIPNATEEINVSLPLATSEIIRQFDLVSDDLIAREKLVDLLFTAAFRSASDNHIIDTANEKCKELYKYDRSLIANEFAVH